MRWVLSRTVKVEDVKQNPPATMKNSSTHLKKMIVSSKKPRVFLQTLSPHQRDRQFYSDRKRTGITVISRHDYCRALNIKEVLFNSARIV